MAFIPLFIEELARETERSRRALNNAPAHQRSWKPHERSMEFGYLADMVATVPSWFTMIVTQPELDVAPKAGRTPRGPASETTADFVAVLEKASADAKSALEATTEEHLQTPWRLLAGGEQVMLVSRQEMLRDTMNHWVHHRGQMTVYLRLMGAEVPALYGPSADDKRYD